MHEPGVAQQIISVRTGQLGRCGASSVTAVGLRIGALSSTHPDALRFCFDALNRDTPLDNATLTIEWQSRFGCPCEPTAIDLEALVGRCPTCNVAESYTDATALDVRVLEIDTVAA